jgi:hypothetical protein
VTGGAGDRDQSGTVIGPREPIGGLRGRHQGRFDWPLHPFQPQLAWLQGTVLIVEVNGESAECDLVTAVRLRIRGRPVPVFNRGWVFDVLYAYQDGTTTPARLVLAGPGWYLLTGQQFRRLAEIIGTRHDAGNRIVRTIIRRLTRMADAQDTRSQPPDWNFRTDPQGLRNKTEAAGLTAARTIWNRPPGCSRPEFRSCHARIVLGVGAGGIGAQCRGHGAIYRCPTCPTC